MTNGAEILKTIVAPFEGDDYLQSHLAQVNDQKQEERQDVTAAFFKQNPTLGWLVDTDGKLHFANPIFYAYFALDEKTAVGKKIMELIPQKITQALYKYHEQAFRSGESVETTKRGQMADGTTILSHINIFPIQIDDKRLIGGLAQIMADRDKLVEALDQAHQRLRDMNKVTNDAIWEWNMKDGTVYRNEALLAMIGYRPDNSRGLSWWLRRIHPEDRNRVSDKVKDATERNQETWQDEYRFKCADGKYKFIQDKGFIVYENGLPVRMTGSLQDVSALKELNRRMTEERRTRQREIMGTMLRSCEKERNRLGDVLNAQVYQVLSSARLYMEMLHPESKRERHFLERGLEYLHHAIDEVRNLSKEMSPPRLYERKLSDSLGTLVNDLRDAGRLQIDFSFDNEVDLVSPEAGVALFRIVQEQLKNIVEHSGAKRARIALHLVESDIRVVVEDNGRGFDPNTTPGGFGLGSIRERAQFLNGNMQILSSRGSGCQLIVTLPFSS